MLSYNKWKQLNENIIGSTYTLGLGKPAKVGELHSRWDEMGMSLPPMKMMKKKMFGGEEGGEEGPDMGMGGGLPSMKKGKKKSPFGKKPPMGPHDDDLGAGEGDVEPGDNADLDMDDEGPLGHDDDDDGDDMDHDDAPLDKDGLDDDDGDEAPVFGKGGPDDDEGMDMPAPKKKGNLVDKTKGVADGAKMMHKGARKMIKAMKEEDTSDLTKKWSSKKCDKSWSSKKSQKMTKEEADFFASLKAQTGGTTFQQDVDGSWAVKEDAIIPPSDPNADIAQDDEPAPGEVGYAPQGRVGTLGTFAEWAARHK